MPRLGVLLLRSGAVTEESVNRALAVQGFAGGRLGTLLIERGSASEDDIGRALAEQHGCEYAPWAVLGTVPATVIAALPAKFAIRHSAVPIGLGEGLIRIALRDPANLRVLDELFFVTGKKIVPAVAPEVRLYHALEKYYGERRTPRFAILAEKLSRPMAPSVIQKPLPPPPDFSSAARELPPGLAPGDPDEPTLLAAWRVPDVPPVGWGGLPPPPEDLDEPPESIPWEETPPTGTWPAAPGVRPAPETARPAGTPSQTRSGEAAAGAPSAWRQTRDAPSPSVAGAMTGAGMPATEDFAGILAARGRDEIFAAALSALIRRFRRSAIFVVRPDGVGGWSGAGEGVDVEALRRLDLPWTEPSIFLNVRMSRSFYLGALPPLARHEALATAIGGWPAECLVQPVLMRDKTVAFFYAECREPQGATPADLTYVRELAGATAAALAASIRLKKKQVI